MRSDDKVSAVEARLQKDIKNLKREKEVLSEDVEVIEMKFQNLLNITEITKHVNYVLLIKR